MAFKPLPCPAAHSSIIFPQAQLYSAKSTSAWSSTKVSTWYKHISRLSWRKCEADMQTADGLISVAGNEREAVWVFWTSSLTAVSQPPSMRSDPCPTHSGRPEACWCCWPLAASSCTTSPWAPWGRAPSCCTDHPAPTSNTNHRPQPWCAVTLEPSGCYYWHQRVCWLIWQHIIQQKSIEIILKTVLPLNNLSSRFHCLQYLVSQWVGRAASHNRTDGAEDCYIYCSTVKYQTSRAHLYFNSWVTKSDDSLLQMCVSYV